MIYNGHYGYLDDLAPTVRQVTAALRPHKSRFDFLCVTGMSGVLVGSAAAIRLAVPLVVVRKQTDDCHDGTDLIGEPRGRYMFIDDFISGGSTFERVRERMADPALDTRYVGCYLYFEKVLSWNDKGPTGCAPPKPSRKYRAKPPEALGISPLKSLATSMNWDATWDPKGLVQLKVS